MFRSRVGGVEGVTPTARFIPGLGPQKREENVLLCMVQDQR